MRIITLNVNGIRAAARKGLFEWLPRQRADVICLQEIKAGPEHLAEPPFTSKSFYAYYEPAVKKGYSGVALLTREHPDGLVRGFGTPEFDHEGRYLEVRFGDLSIVSLYVPSGSAGEHRQQSKFRFMKAFMEHLRRIRRDGRRYVICGDWNIAHREIDLKNWRANQKNSGFLPEERAWMDEVLGEVGLKDAFRLVDDRPEQYTWWSNRGQAWAKNVGWRIDYQLVSPELASRVEDAGIYKRKRFSDHAPLIMDYRLDAG
ncbi:MAG: exodeoxyribonuclease [Gammaproteobacteria bacterium]|nr:MAG: exodeoxyribonuclease III [Pseudomonadota bacterium]MBC6945413.1 exodeoxyribonuclease III [Gammaproteobacteria bacterium]MCE7896861.1 exodeoxyribonuclease III [Gammaproteobacteria bacterium PRO8]MDL1881100.1 exodeoxyribonuclease III [Gammaproteobacteria bacterium PRO2]MCL4776797.1 exodeoxyribonuclease III [Gammaproteobacteria bacterium]